MHHITKEPKYYIYRHTKIGTSEVFYIGLGGTDKYERAYRVRGRNEGWKEAYNDSGREVEILAHGLTIYEAEELERILIPYYGRIDKGTGTLTNKNNGGRGNVGCIKTEEQKKKQSESVTGDKHPNWGKKLSDETKKLISKVHLGKPKSKEHIQKMIEYRTGRNLRGEHPNALKVKDTVTDVIYSCIEDASDAFNIKYKTLHSYLRGYIKNPTTLILYEQKLNNHEK